ncbi:hypothetical protein Nepgr_005244 [Nepenthes gracilis]|uniref:Uncharacterized protein n=1 Tax=Nepenthes gracilis TaxID=150966 RepID=A0AAD3XG65_NEPGR|nr:hypothetical protein Nepgr_005244 [Nepenthes gracilis]
MPIAADSKEKIRNKSSAAAQQISKDAAGTQGNSTATKQNSHTMLVFKSTHNQKRQENQKLIHPTMKTHNRLHFRCSTSKPAIINVAEKTKSQNCCLPLQQTSYTAATAKSFRVDMCMLAALTTLCGHDQN